MAQSAAERAEAPAVANSAPLGFSAFALTTFVLSASNAGFLFSKVEGATLIVVGLAIFYGGLVQVLAGLLEFRRGNTFGVTAFCSYGGFWLAIGFILLPLFAGGTKNIVDLVGAPNGEAGVGVFFLGWTIFTGLMFLGTLRSSLALRGLFFFLFLTFLALTIGWLGGGSTHTTFVPIGGWLGLITAVLAWYNAAAGVIHATNSAGFIRDRVRFPGAPRA